VETLAEQSEHSTEDADPDCSPSECTEGKDAGARRGGLQLLELQGTAAVKKNDNEGQRSEVRCDGTEHRSGNEAANGAKGDTRKDQPDHIWDICSLKNELTDGADQEDPGDGQEEERDGIVH